MCICGVKAPEDAVVVADEDLLDGEGRHVAAHARRSVAKRAKRTAAGARAGGGAPADPAANCCCCSAGGGDDDSAASRDAVVSRVI
jgi:hypothetical protein